MDYQEYVPRFWPEEGGSWIRMGTIKRVRIRFRDAKVSLFGSMPTSTVCHKCHAEQREWLTVEPSDHGNFIRSVEKWNEMHKGELISTCIYPGNWKVYHVPQRGILRCCHWTWSGPDAEGDDFLSWSDTVLQMIDFYECLGK